MPDTPAQPPSPSDRIAVLEEIAAATKQALSEIRADIRSAIERIDRRLDTIEKNQRSDFRWLLGIMIGGFGATLAGFISLLGVMARGFGWL
jgi:hypothetical protein